MVSRAFEEEILKYLNSMEKKEQNKVLTYIKSLLKKKTSSSSLDLQQLAGSIDPKTLQEMSKAIEAGCENIDRNEW